jgi:hypothetical protein
MQVASAAMIRDLGPWNFYCTHIQRRTSRKEEGCSPLALSNSAISFHRNDVIAAFCQLLPLNAGKPPI